MKSTTNKLGRPFGQVWDERQQQSYHRINSTAYNIIWFLLLTAIFVQVLLYPAEPGRWLAEIGLFLLLSAYTSAAYLRAGLWTKGRQQPSARQSLLVGLASAALLTVLSLVRMALSGHAGRMPFAGGLYPALPFLLIQGAVVFLGGWGLMWLLGAYHRKKKRQVDASLDAEE